MHSFVGARHGRLNCDGRFILDVYLSNNLKIKKTMKTNGKKFDKNKNKLPLK